MKANYGYLDATGEYYLTVDTERCNGCSECLKVCPQQVLELYEDDDGEEKVRVKEALVKKLGFLCSGHRLREAKSGCGLACEKVCLTGALEHSW